MPLFDTLTLYNKTIKLLKEAGDYEKNEHFRKAINESVGEEVI